MTIRKLRRLDRYNFNGRPFESLLCFERWIILLFFPVDFDALRWSSEENPYFVLPFEEEEELEEEILEEEELEEKKKKRKKRSLPYGGDR